MIDPEIVRNMSASSESVWNDPLAGLNVENGTRDSRWIVKGMMRPADNGEMTKKPTILITAVRNNAQLLLLAFCFLLSASTGTFHQDLEGKVRLKGAEAP